MKRFGGMKKVAGIWHCLYPFLLYYVLSNIVYFCVMAATELIYRWVNKLDVVNVDADMKQLDDFFTSYGTLVYLGAMIAAAVVLCVVFYNFYRKDREEIASFALFTQQKPLTWILIGVAGICVSNALNNIVFLTDMDAVFTGYEEVANRFYTGQLLLELLAYGILVPIAEELMHRGLIYQRLKVEMNQNFAVIVSCLLFGMFHGNTLQGLYGVSVAFLCIFVLEKTRAIAAPILVHVAANVVSIVLTETALFEAIYTNVQAMTILTVVEAVIAAGSIWYLHKSQPDVGL